MADQIHYLLKVNLALVIFYLAYRLLFQRSGSHVMNRYYLLSAIVVAMVAPALNFNWLSSDVGHITGTEILVAPGLQYIVTAATAATEVSKEALGKRDLLAGAYAAGLGILLLRLCVQFVALLRMHLRSCPAEIHGVPVRVLADKVSPFSFWRTIYINPGLHSAEELPAILSHEKVHTGELHSLDVIAAEFLGAVLWCNPFAWLLRDAIRNNLEYVADSAVIDSGFDSRTYQHAILQATLKSAGNPIVNHFYSTALKKRIVMMNRKHPGKFQQAAIGMSMAIVLLIAASFGGQNSAVGALRESPLATIVPEVVVDRIDEVVAAVESVPAEVIPEPPVVSADTIKPTPAEKLIKELTKDSLVKPVYLVDGKRTTIVPETDEIRSVSVFKGEQASSRFGSDAAGGAVSITTKQSGDDSSVIEFRGYATPNPQPAPVKVDLSNIGSQLLIINGKESSKDALEDIPTSQIMEIRVVGGSTATERYGEKGSKGVIEITLNK